ncbi:copper chaperone PCu(A)C [Taylorella equigenitalis]|nr:copper chaperone PCu(A)C [Taylorella equigenitalis]WFE03481.1 copper chaperone PCu(A)C [Taylorella equigenitalis]WFE10882.1 copper chaperone PCu(A)C [Taylorella equigenitalis]WGQ27370.1 copper chaperone PCu(A)C [Taylorella equigenitalis]WGU11210.1 copper chaperone PCu(A)C [Taylorella equigenitalis]
MSSNDLEVNKCWIRLFPSDRFSALYFDVTNNSETETAYIVGVSSEKFKEADMHETYTAEGVMAGMRSVDWVEVAPKSTVNFKSGGYHVMLSKHEVNVGDEVEFSLKLSNHETKSFSCKANDIKSVAY